MQTVRHVNMHTSRVGSLGAGRTGTPGRARVGRGIGSTKYLPAVNQKSASFLGSEEEDINDERFCNRSQYLVDKGQTSFCPWLFVLNLLCKRILMLLNHIFIYTHQ